jgi:hypothetical protein
MKSNPPHRGHAIRLLSGTLSSGYSASLNSVSPVKNDFNPLFIFSNSACASFEISIFFSPSMLFFWKIIGFTPPCTYTGVPTP